MGKIDDGYVSSTGFMIKAYRKRPKDFKRRVLEYYYGDNSKELLEIEQKYLNMIKEAELCNRENIRLKTSRYYNIKKNASGISGKIASDMKKQYWNSDKGQAHKERLSAQFKTDNISKKGKSSWNKGKKCPTISQGRRLGKKPEISSDIRSATTKMLWENGIYDNRKKPSKETTEKISKSLKGRNLENSTKEKISKALKGVSKSEDHRNSLSVIAKERSSKLIECPICGFIGNGPVMNRWHFSNCKK